MAETKFKEGDKLVCLPGFIQGDGPRFQHRNGGAGYEQGRALPFITVKRVTNAYEDKPPIYWFEEIMHGIYEQALRKYDAVNDEYKLF